MKRFKTINLELVCLCFHPNAQGPSSGSTPSFVVNLIGNPSGVWTSPNISSGGACCGTNNCVYFYVTLDSNTAGIQIDMTGTNPSGSLFYDINCAGNYPGGSVKCINGVERHEITICKPGNNANTYTITSVGKPKFPNDDSIRIGCKHHFFSNRVANNSVIWNSIYPGTPGQYKNYLDSTHVASLCQDGAINVTAGGGVNPISYQWLNGSTKQNLNGITSDTYSVVYTDKNNCSDSPSILLNQPQALSLSRNVKGIRRYSDTLGGIEIFCNGRTAPTTIYGRTVQRILLCMI